MAQNAARGALILLALLGMASVGTAKHRSQARGLHQWGGTPGPAPGPSHGGMQMGRTQVVRQCNDVCRDDCQQAVDTKCNTVPYQDQVCTDKAYTTYTTDCRKDCTTTTTQQTVASHGMAYAPVMTQSVGKGAMSWGGKHGRLRQLLGWGGKGKMHTPVMTSSSYGKGQVAVPVTTHQTISVPQTTCRDVCQDIPQVSYKQDCQTITKTRQDCQDFVQNVCKKVCTPQCNEYTNTVPTVAASYGKGRH